MRRGYVRFIADGAVKPVALASRLRQRRDGSSVLLEFPRARRTALAALSLFLTVAGAEVFAWAGGAGETIADLWLPVLLASAVPPTLGAVLHGRRIQRWVCLLGALVTGLVALVLIPYGYGIFQLPAVVALVVAGATRD